jgi:hypothetical protein
MRIFTTKCLTFVEVAPIAREDILQRECASQSMCQLSQLSQIRLFFPMFQISVDILVNWPIYWNLGSHRNEKGHYHCIYWFSKLIDLTS